MMTPTGSISWFDFPTKDETKAIPFFEKLFAWKFSPMGPNYWAITVEEQMIGALRKEELVAVLARDAFVTYFTVPSIKEANSIITQQGGNVEGEMVAIQNGEKGYFQTFKDLDGNNLALWSMKP